MIKRKGLQQNRPQHTLLCRASYVGRLSVLAASLLSIHTSAFALQELSDQTLRQIDGQDGIVINTAYDSLHFDNLYWNDKAGTSADSEITLRNYVNNVDITGANLGSTIKINTGSDGTSAGLDLQVSANLGTISAKEFRICNGSTGSVAADCTGTNSQSMGAVAIQTNAANPAVFNLRTFKGLFNSTSLAHLDVGLRNLNLYLSQKESATVSNQVILKDFNFNFSADGYLYVSDKNGITLETRDVGNYVNLTRVQDPAYASDPTKTKPGLNIELMYKGGLANPVTAYDLSNAKGMIRIGASGKMTNSIIQLRGINASGVAAPVADPTIANNVLGFAYDPNGTTTSTGPNASVIGTTGIVARLKTDFVGAGTGAVPNPDQVTLELGHAGNNAYGVRFGNLTPLLIRDDDTGGALSTKLAYFDSGSVYVNLTNTKSILLPQNTVLNTARFGASGTLTTAVDYTQKIYPDTNSDKPNSVVFAVRGMNFQALSRTGTFIASNDLPAPTSTGTWGLSLPIYNLNTNLALYGTTPVSGEERLGFSLGMSTQGINYDSTKTLAQNQALGNDGSKTTSILLVDGEKYSQAPDPTNPLLRKADPAGDPINYYFGLRNIDMLITANGSLSLKQGTNTDSTRYGNINVDIPDLSIVASAEVAAGYLPGSQYRTKSAGYVKVNNFTTKDDVLFGLKVKIKGKMNLNLVPPTQATPTADQNRLSFEGTFTSNGAGGSAIQISDATNGSIFALDNITGNVDFANQIKVNSNNFDFNFKFDMNKGALQSTNLTAIGVLANNTFRVKDINLYPSTGNGNAQRLGEIAIPGGTLTAKLNIIPR